jgi:hypothetical protein
VQRIARQIRLSGSIGNQWIFEHTGNMDLLFFPNPFKKELYVQSADQIINNVLVYDHTGLLVKRIGNVYSKDSVIHLDNPDGIYFVKVTLKNGQTYTSKILKQ